MEKKKKNKPKNPLLAWSSFYTGTQNAGERRWLGESCWSDSGDGDLIFVLHLFSILLGPSKGINSERTYYAHATAQIMHAILLTILCKVQVLLSLHRGTVHTGRISKF